MTRATAAQRLTSLHLPHADVEAEPFDEEGAELALGDPGPPLRLVRVRP